MTVDDYSEFAWLLNHYLRKEDRKIGWLAEQLKVDAGTVSGWPAGRTLPESAERIRQIADVLQIETSDERRDLLEAAGYPYVAGEVDEDETAGISGGKRHIESARVPEAHLDTATLMKERRFQAPPKIQDFVGRQELLEEIKSALQAGGQICILRGMGGSAKQPLPRIWLTSWMPISLTASSGLI